MSASSGPRCRAATMKVVALALAAAAVACTFSTALPEPDAAVLLAAAGLGLVWAQGRRPQARAGQASNRSGAR